MSTYNQIYPVSQKMVYGANDNVDFSLSFENKYLVCNSIRISGTLNVLNAGTAIGANEAVYYDPVIGIHGFFSSMTVFSDALGMIETIDNYGRAVKQSRMCTKTTSQLISQSSTLSELCVGPALISSQTILRVATSFSFKPDICLNAMVNDMQNYGNVDYKKTRNIKISTRVANIAEALWGANAFSCGINISDLRLDFITTDVSDGTKQCLMLTKNLISQTVSSTQSSYSINIPSGSCRAVSGSFLQQSNSLSLQSNNYELEEPTGGISKVYYMYKDSTDGFLLAYGLETRQDILLNFIRSYSSVSDSKESASLFNIQTNKFYGIGLNFMDNIDLMNEKFTLTLTSAITQVAPYYLYLVFTSLRTL